VLRYERVTKKCGLEMNREPVNAPEWAVCLFLTAWHLKMGPKSSPETSV
jgi:hypothetical protein